MTILPKLGQKGQVVIEKAIRDRLGIGPGWQAVQAVVDDHVELRFIPPPHNRSLFGVLRPHITRVAPPEEEWDDAIARAAAAEYQEQLDGE